MSLLIDQSDGITTFTINRPAARNAVDPETATNLFEGFLEFQADARQKVAILTGADGAFCAGYDLKAAARGMNADWAKRHDIPNDWTDPVENPLPSPMGPARLMLSKPVIAAIEGPAVAGGMELALWADVRLIAQSAYFGVFCRRWGVPLIDGGTVRLPEIVGLGRAQDLILTGRPVHATEAKDIGLANDVVADGSTLDAAKCCAHDLMCFPQNCMRADKLHALGPRRRLAEALFNEWQGTLDLLQDAAKGAARFSAGKGRAGNFHEI